MCIELYTTVMPVSPAVFTLTPSPSCGIVPSSHLRITHLAFRRSDLALLTLELTQRGGVEAKDGSVCVGCVQGRQGSDEKNTTDKKTLTLTSSAWGHVHSFLKSNKLIQHFFLSQVSLIQRFS